MQSCLTYQSKTVSLTRSHMEGNYGKYSKYIQLNGASSGLQPFKLAAALTVILSVVALEIPKCHLEIFTTFNLLQNLEVICAVVWAILLGKNPLHATPMCRVEWKLTSSVIVILTFVPGSFSILRISYLCLEVQHFVPLWVRILLNDLSTQLESQKDNILACLATQQCLYVTLPL